MKTKSNTQNTQDKVKKMMNKVNFMIGFTEEAVTLSNMKILAQTAKLKVA